jgi:hypothetical protein
VCYPYFIGITKEMMSRGPQVADMEYRETASPAVSTCTNRDLLHHHKSQVHHEDIHHISLVPEDIRSSSMRYKPGIIVSVISIFEAFEIVAFKTAFDYVTSTSKLCYLPCFTLVVDNAP